MSIFNTIMNTIFHHPAATAAADTTAAPATATPGETAAPTPTGTAASAQPGEGAAQPVDVGAVLAQMATERGQPSNYKTSIVDLMTLLGLDSSIGARKELAHELGYTGSPDDSYAMNVWLHRQVMEKLEQNGGKVPADLKTG